jgi:membrane-bound serine protease (ClpP class)
MAAFRRLMIGLGFLALAAGGGASGQDKLKAPEAARAGRFFTVTEPINGVALDAIKSATTQYLRSVPGETPYLVLEFRSEEADAGRSEFFASADLADFLSRQLSGRGHTVAYVPSPLSGPAVLAVLACDDIVLGENASLGPIINLEDSTVDPRTARSLVEGLASRKSREVDLYLGILNGGTDLLEVTLANNTTRFVVPENAANLEGVINQKSAWEPGRRGVLTPELARRTLVKLIAQDRNTIKQWYRLASTADDPTLGGPTRSVLVNVNRVIDQVTFDYVRKSLSDARNQGVNLIVLRIDSEGGQTSAAERLAELLGNLDKQIKTVAYVDNRAMGVAALLPMACDEVVLSNQARWGDVSRMITADGASEPIDPATLTSLSEKARVLANRKGHSGAVAAAVFNPALALHQALDQQTGAVVPVLQSDLVNEPARYQLRATVKPEGQTLVITPENAGALGMSTRVGLDRASLMREFGIQGRMREVEPSWVDTLVTILNTPWVSWLLLFVGLFMLILELKLPGVGLPAIISALCFLLFFWGHSRAGTADTLEILLFLTGVVCLVLELFVFPGFGVFGLTGVLLVLVSIIMASHTFIWPTQEYEYRQLGGTLFAITATLFGVGFGAFMLGKFLPSVPLFRRLVLVPEPLTPDDPTAKPALDPTEATYYYLLGEQGRTTTVLRPTGKARFGDQLVDVTADGFFIEAHVPVEVTDVQGTRVIVKKVTS